jgi:ankyrin repeat protein
MKEALVPPKRWFLQEPHDITSQKTPFFIVTAVKTSILHDADNAMFPKNVLGDTPLHVAAARGHLEVVKLLLSCGADPQLHNKDQQTPTDLAMNSAIVNLLQMSSSAHQRRSIVTYDADEYAGDSD